MANFKVLRNEYETLGTSIKELAASHHTSEALINAAIKEGKWERMSLEQMDTMDTSARLTAMDLKNQTELVPKFIALQSKMLEKCDVLLDGVKGLDNAGDLKIVSEVIEKHRPAVMGNKDGDKSDNNITVRILSKVGNAADVAINAVEITTQAGESNGLGVPRGTPIN